jgi:hypothetical protein
VELIQAFAAFFATFLIVAAVLQLVAAYSLQVIAEKNELPDFAAFLAWIPLLQIYPAIKVGGGDFKKLVLGGLGAVVAFAVVAGGSAAAGFGGVGTGVAGAALVIVAIVYFARIAMGTAERRGLSKWLGLLMFVPIAQCLVYPYIAFHDGWKPPNKLGLVLGLLLAFGPIPGQLAMIDGLTEQAQTMAQADLGDGVTFEQAMSGLGATMEIGAQVAMLDGMDPADPSQAQAMMQAIADAQQKLEESRDAIGPDAYEELNGLIAAQSQRLAGAPAGGAPIAIADAGAPALRARPAAVQIGPPLTAGMPRNGDEGFEVPVNPACPPGTTQRSSQQGGALREWCEKIGVDAGIKHGWMTEYHANGVAAVAGEYRDGLRVGVWTRYHDNGVKRVQAEFENGLQDGILISWGPDGTKIYEKYFSQGAPASR